MLHDEFEPAVKPMAPFESASVSMPKASVVLELNVLFAGVAIHLVVSEVSFVTGLCKFVS